MKLATRIDGPEGAPVVVLLTAIGATVDMWEPCTGPLAEHFRVVRVDTRGHGDSERSAPGNPCGISDLGADVLETLDDLRIPQFHLAGLSLGGMVAMWLAIHHPSRVRRLALLCTTSHFPPPERWHERAALVRAEGIAAVAAPAVERWLTPSIADRDPALVARLHEMHLRVDAESYAQCCEAIAAMDQRADLGRISAPTLVVAGAEDPSMPPPVLEELARGIPGARLVVVDPAAHLAAVEQPGVIAQELVAHFGGPASLATGFATRRGVLGDAHVDRSIATTTPLTAPFQDFITRYAWGEVWSRPGLARRDRSIATLAALVTLGAEHDIAMHVRAALRNGLAPEEIGEVLLHTALYAGLPRANRAFAIAREVLEDPASDAGGGAAQR